MIYVLPTVPLISGGMIVALSTIPVKFLVGAGDALTKDSILDSSSFSCVTVAFLGTALGLILNSNLSSPCSTAIGFNFIGRSASLSANSLKLTSRGGSHFIGVGITWAKS